MCLAASTRRNRSGQSLLLCCDSCQRRKVFEHFCMLNAVRYVGTQRPGTRCPFYRRRSTVLRVSACIYGRVGFPQANTSYAFHWQFKAAIDTSKTSSHRTAVGRVFSSESETSGFHQGSYHRTVYSLLWIRVVLGASHQHHGLVSVDSRPSIKESKLGHRICLARRCKEDKSPDAAGPHMISTFIFPFDSTAAVTCLSFSEVCHSFESREID